MSRNVSDFTLKDLREGYFIDYNKKSWQITGEFEYDWGHQKFSSVYKLKAGGETVFLRIQDLGERRISVSKSIETERLGDGIVDEIIKKGLPEKLEYEGVAYYFRNEKAGYFNDKSSGSKEWETIINWEYFDKKEKQILCIYKWYPLWGEQYFSAFLVKEIEENEISKD
ncbi:MAG: DUF4178 domain-containing protein [Bacteroidota bacterium]